MRGLGFLDQDHCPEAWKHFFVKQVAARQPKVTSFFYAKN